MAFYASNTEKKVFHTVLIHQLKRLFDEEDETSVEDFLRAKLDKIKSENSTKEKEEIIALLLSFMNDVSATYDQFNKSLMLKTRSIAMRSGELTQAHEKISKNDKAISDSVLNLKVSLADLLGKKNEDEISFEDFEIQELTELIKTLIQKNKATSKKLKKNNKKLKLQREELAHKNRDILDGIEYAKRIQDTLLSDSALLLKNFPDSFLLNLPKEIVSGDFFWIHEFENKVIMAVADCTGHGVPGAFTSIISNMLLNEIVLNSKITNPAEILQALNERITHIFRLHENKAHSHEGLDIAVCLIDKENDLIRFAGAGRPLFLVRNKELSVLKGSNQTIGGFPTTAPLHYQGQEISLEENDRVYLFSDGYVDQFAAENYTKFSTKRFQEILIEMSHETSALQLQRLIHEHQNWKGENQQVDDILIVGFRYQIN